MKSILKAVEELSRSVNVVSQVVLTLMMLLTVFDVILRAFNRPIIGTYEIVSYSGAIVIGFSVPVTSWMRGHVSVDLFTSRLSERTRRIFDIGTRCMVIILFLLLAWRLFAYGISLQRTKELSMTLRFPYYPVAFGLGIAFCVQCLVLFCDILKIRGGSYE